jgi:hypothetical protein
MSELESHVLCWLSLLFSSGGIITGGLALYRQGHPK